MKTELILQQIQQRFPILTEQERRVNSLISHIDKTDPLRECYKAVMTNQVKYCERSPEAGDSLDITAEIAVKFLDNFKILHEFMSVQPLQKPVGDIYKLRTRYKDDKRMSLEVLKETIEVGTRKANAQLELTHEQLDDAKDRINSDEMISQIGKELAEEQLDHLMWDITLLAMQNPQFDETIVITKDYDPDWLVCEINRRASDIARVTRRGYGNFVITGQKVLDVLEQASGYKSLGEELSDALIQPVGEINGIKAYLYKNANDMILNGYCGKNNTDAGMCYSPYIPVMTTGPVIDPLTFQPLLIFMTQYGIAVDTDSAGYYNGAKVVFE